MRVIQGPALLYFLCLVALPLALGFWSFLVIERSMLLPGAGGVFNFLTSILVFYTSLIGIYRLYLYKVGFPMGVIPVGSQAERQWMIYILFWLLFFFPVVIPRWIPIPLSGWWFRLLGGNIGPKSYFSGVIYDPHLVTIGHHVLGGAQSMIVPHIAEGEYLAHHPIHIGNHVTIGAGAVILPGVVVEDHVMIGAGAIIPKNARLLRGEVWAGNPARLIKRKPIPGNSHSECVV
jgi:hypothetical protein